MGLNRKLALATTVVALTLAPLSLATAADAAPTYSVSVLHCHGGIAVRGYATHTAALRAKNKAVYAQRHNPASVRTVQLRHGSLVVSSSTRPC
jgi:hypothetical protein